MNESIKELIEEKKRMDDIAFNMTKEERFHICDMGFYNSVIEGYLIRAMKNAEFNPEDIRKAVTGLHYALDDLSAADAEKETI